MWSEAICEGLKASGVKMLAYVPDLMLEEVLRQARGDPFFDVLGLTREEEGVGVVSGAYLGGVRGALLMQSSGLGNSVGALSSFCLPFQIPFLIFISQRGELGEFNTCQVPMGRAVRPILDSLGIPYYTFDREETVSTLVASAARQSFSCHLPVALIIPTSLSGGKQG